MTTQHATLHFAVDDYLEEKGQEKEVWSYARSRGTDRAVCIQDVYELFSKLLKGVFYRGVLEGLLGGYKEFRLYLI